MTGQVAVKRLAAVEIDPDSSHQHEFNAGRLRVALGFGSGTATGRMRVLYYAGGEGAEPDTAVGEYTLYDAREAHPTRSEYRLYYSIPLIREKASAGDLLVLFRAPGSDELSAVVAKAGSSVEEKLLDTLFLGDEPALESFRLVAPPTPSRKAAENLVAAMAPAPVLPRSYRASEHPLYGEALAAGELPSGASMAVAGQDLAESAIGIDPSDDERLEFGLDAETELYLAITHELGERQLATLREAGAGFAAIAAYVMQISQSARSRRGASLQWHFMAVLERAGIPFRSQCPTEGKERPDFVIPGHLEYHDSHYPSSRLRMVACKSTVKERWRQILTEAARIDEKYLLTLDTQLTDNTVSAMRAAMLRPFLPVSILNREYALRPSRVNLATVQELVAELRSVV